MSGVFLLTQNVMYVQRVVSSTTRLVTGPRLAIPAAIYRSAQGPGSESAPQSAF